MADEPFVTPYSGRKRRVQFMSGGKLAGAESTVPPCDGSCNNFVLTNVGGVPTWRPSGAAPGPYLDPGYWLKGKTCYFKQDELPVNDNLFSRNNYRGGQLGRPFGQLYQQETLLLGSGTGTSMTGVMLPITTDGQTFATPLSGDIATWYTPTSFEYSGEFQERVAAWEIRFEFVTGPGTGSLSITTDGAARSSTGENLWWETEQFNGVAAGGALSNYIPSALNTIASTQSGAPGITGTWSDSCSWEVYLSVWRQIPA